MLVIYLVETKCPCFFQSKAFLKKGYNFVLSTLYIHRYFKNMRKYENHNFIFFDLINIILLNIGYLEYQTLHLIKKTKQGIFSRHDLDIKSVGTCFSLLVVLIICLFLLFVYKNATRIHIIVHVILYTFSYSTLINYIVVTSPGSIIGATLGGAVLGSILTMIVFVCIRRRSHSLDDSKE